MDLHAQMLAMGDRALEAARQLVTMSAKKKNLILQAMADEIEASRAEIQAANARDLAAGREAALSSAMLDRLELTDARIEAMATGLSDVAGLRNPVGSRISQWIRPNGLQIEKKRVPIGVIGIIYESRPNVTADAAGLCLKTANAVILRGGKEAVQSNQAIVDALKRGGAKKGMPEHTIQLVETIDRDAVRELCQMVGRVDLIIPRGGERLIQVVSEMAHVPVIKHSKGLCHTYVDESANLAQAIEIAVNAKCQRPGVCNAMETLLVHEAVAAELLPDLAREMQERGVEIRGDAAARALVPDMAEATEEDWHAEYLDLTLAIRVVDSVRAAVDHINTYGSQHSDAIVAESEKAQRLFTTEVDSATVYVNASTRFTDGFEFGMGAEIGISTDKLHARGPMGLEELTTYKYVVHGQGQVKA